MTTKRTSSGQDATKRNLPGNYKCILYRYSPLIALAESLSLHEEFLKRLTNTSFSACSQQKPPKLTKKALALSEQSAYLAAGEASHGNNHLGTPRNFDRRETEEAKNANESNKRQVNNQ